jgi:hypothetical protein
MVTDMGDMSIWESLINETGDTPADLSAPTDTTDTTDVTVPTAPNAPMVNVPADLSAPTDTTAPNKPNTPTDTTAYGNSPHHLTSAPPTTITPEISAIPLLSGERENDAAPKTAFAVLKIMAQEKTSAGDKFSLDSIGKALETEIKRKHGG